jgi:hypothetical protein
MKPARVFAGFVYFVWNLSGLCGLWRIHIYRLLPEGIRPLSSWEFGVWVVDEEEDHLARLEAVRENGSPTRLDDREGGQN